MWQSISARQIFSLCTRQIYFMKAHVHLHFRSVHWQRGGRPTSAASFFVHLYMLSTLSRRCAVRKTRIAFDMPIKSSIVKIVLHRSASTNACAIYHSDDTFSIKQSKASKCIPRRGCCKLRLCTFIIQAMLQSQALAVIDFKDPVLKARICVFQHIVIDCFCEPFHVFPFIAVSKRVGSCTNNWIVQSFRQSSGLRVECKHSEISFGLSSRTFEKRLTTSVNTISFWLNTLQLASNEPWLPSRCVGGTLLSLFWTKFAPLLNWKQIDW